MTTQVNRPWSAETSPTPPPGLARRLRRIVLVTTLASFTAAAALGVAVLLVGRDLGETEVRVLLTTLLLGVTSLAVLCYLTTAETDWWPVGLAGGLVAVVPVLCALDMIWIGGESAQGPLVVKSFAIGGVLAGSLAQLALLLALSRGRAPLLVALTSMAVLTLAALVTTVVLLDGDVGDSFGRILGVVMILDVLGTIVTIAVTRFGHEHPDRPRPDRDPLPAGGAQPGREHGASQDLALAPDLAASLGRLAAARGAAVPDLLDEAVREYLARREG